MERLEESETLRGEGDLIIEIGNDAVPTISAFKDVDGACAIGESTWRAVGYLPVKDVEASDSVRHYLF